MPLDLGVLAFEKLNDNKALFKLLIRPWWMSNYFCEEQLDVNILRTRIH